ACPLRVLHSFPTRRSSDLDEGGLWGRLVAGHDLAEALLVPAQRFVAGFDECLETEGCSGRGLPRAVFADRVLPRPEPQEVEAHRSEEHTSELQSPYDLVCR